MLFPVIQVMRRDIHRKAQPEEEWGLAHVMRSLATADRDPVWRLL
jgi:hypothetical protein